MEAILLACGELGYRRVTLPEILSRASVTKAEFGERFAGLSECFAVAFGWEAERLSTTVLGAGVAGSSWRRGLRAALDSFAAYLVQRPLHSRAMLLEVHVAGGAALRRRTEILEHLASAIDSGRQQSDPNLAPPPLTGLFMVGAIEAAAVSALVGGEPEAFGDAVPELEQLVAAAYLHD